MVNNAKRVKTQHTALPTSSSGGGGVDFSAALDAFAPADDGASGDLFHHPGSPSSLDWNTNLDLWATPQQQQSPFGNSSSSMGPPMPPPAAAAASSSSNLLPPQGPPSSNDVTLDPVPEVAPLPKRKKAAPKSRKRKSNAGAEAEGEVEASASPPKATGKKGAAAAAAAKSVSASPVPAVLPPPQATSMRPPVQTTPSSNFHLLGQSQAIASPQLPASGTSWAQQSSQRQASFGSSSQPSQFQPPSSLSSLGATQSQSQSQSQLQSQSQATTAATSAAGANDGVDDLQDVMGQSGVDLRAEEERMQQRFQPPAAYSHSQAQPSSQGANFSSSTTTLELYPLAIKVHSIASKHGLSVEPEVLNYLSLAAKVRFRALLSGMISASRHRAWSTHQRAPPLYAAPEEGGEGEPMFHVELRRDPSVALAALERVERVQEQAARKLRMERDEREANAALLGAEGGSGTGGGDAEMTDGAGTPLGGGGAKRKPVSQAAQAKNMSEEVRRRLANNTAARQLGGSASAPKWMSLGGAAAVLAGGEAPASPSPSTPAASGISALPKPRFAPLAAGVASLSSGGKGALGMPKREWQLAPSTLGTSSSANASASTSTTAATGGWADLSARQRQREAEQRRRMLAVTLPDALHALELERAAGKGKGSGEMAAYKARARRWDVKED